MIIKSGVSTASSQFDSYVELNLLNLIINKKRISFIRRKATVVKSVQSTLSYLITTSVPRAMFTHFLVEHGLSQYYLY